ncbi:MAG: DNA mismatch repair endonuclease MutL [Gammaproteobacteria bacterium]|nr:DNA mismatch repair endonuclease MutL [Gammaproteobacteria bacterium]
MTDVGSDARIRVLLPYLANQIAAGEVIERPASVVKELLENSLDSISTQIDIAVERGGIRSIRVQDNGSGIHPDDLLLALSRHATSKISVPEDLGRVRTLGFRGEALPSIGSVSRLTLVSRTKQNEMGWAVTSLGEKSPTMPEPRPHPLGTTVEVRDLFFNTPARRKFLHSEKTEFFHVHGIVKRMALSHFDVGMTLHHNDRPVFKLRPAVSEEEQNRRVASLLGGAFLEKALRIDYQAGGLRVWGWLGLPATARSQTDMQHVYLNGRMIRDKRVNHALRQAYEDMLYPGRHPAYVLYLEVDPSSVDVNVHPTKFEVRFQEARTVHDFLYGSLHQVLSGYRPLTTMGGVENERAFHPLMANRLYSPLAPHGRRLGFPLLKKTSVDEPVSFDVNRCETAVTDAPSHRHVRRSEVPPLGRPLATLHGRYLLAETETGLIIVDIPAAQVRIALERIKAAYESGRVRSRPLLIPETVAVDEATADRVDQFTSQLNRMGLVVIRVGPNRLLVREVPALLAGANVSALVCDVLAALAAHSNHAEAGPPPRSLLATLAQHAKDNVNCPLDLEGMNALLRELERIEPGAEGCQEGLVWGEITVEALQSLVGRSQ